MSLVRDRLVYAIAVAGAVVVCAGVVGMTHACVDAQPATPPPAANATSVQHGKTVYIAHCVECHGASGRGDGPASWVLTPRPRDFASGKYKIRTAVTARRRPRAQTSSAISPAGSSSSKTAGRTSAGT